MQQMYMLACPASVMATATVFTVRAKRCPALCCDARCFSVLSRRLFDIGVLKSVLCSL